MIFFKCCKREKIARRIAEKHGLLEEYKIARGNGCSPIEALEEWDLLQPEDYKLFE